MSSTPFGRVSDVVPSGLVAFVVLVDDPGSRSLVVKHERHDPQKYADKASHEKRRRKPVSIDMWLRDGRFRQVDKRCSRDEQHSETKAETDLCAGCELILVRAGILPLDNNTRNVHDAPFEVVVHRVSVRYRHCITLTLKELKVNRLLTSLMQSF